MDIYGSGSDDSDSDSEEYDYNQHGDISDGLLSENGDTDLGTTTLRTQQSVAQDTQRAATSISTSVLPSSGDIRHPLIMDDISNHIFIYTKTASCEKRVQPQNARVKKDVKSKVAAKKWLR